MTQKEKIVQYLEKKYPIILKRNEAKKELEQEIDRLRNPSFELRTELL